MATPTTKWGERRGELHVEGLTSSYSNAHSVSYQCSLKREADVPQHVVASKYLITLATYLVDVQDRLFLSSDGWAPTEADDTALK